ncbi:MAG: heme exporter protein CcmD [Rhodobacteraceae bacterium]|nr:heme exporter protein CcmD [Paracoccaceae bacterium]
MTLGPHAEFILAAYGACALVIVALTAWILFEKRSLEKTLGRLSARFEASKTDKNS